MAITNYSELQSAISRWLHRSDLATAIPDFVMLAETRFNRDLRLRKQETVSTGTLSGNTIAYPSDLSTLSRITVTASGQDWELKYRGIEDSPMFSVDTGIPQYFSEINQLYLLFPAPDGNYPYTIYYTANFPNLSTGAPTNWMITNAPDVYLYASLIEASPYLKDDGRVDLWATAYQRAIQALQAQDDMNQYPVQSALQIRSDVNR